MFSRCFPSVETHLGNSMFSKSFRLGRCMEYILYSSQKYMMFLMSLCKKNTLLMDILCDFVWEMFGKLMEYTKFPTKYYIMYPLVRYSFCKNSSKTSCIPYIFQA